MDLNLSIGIIGMSLILIAFVGDLFKIITEDYLSYNLLNIFGGLALAYYAYKLGSGPFLILQLVWVLCSVYKLMILKKK